MIGPRAGSCPHARWGARRPGGDGVKHGEDGRRGSSGPAHAGHPQVLSRRGGPGRRRPRGAEGRGARPPRGERGGEVDAHEDPERRDPERRGRDRAPRAGGRDPGPRPRPDPGDPDHLPGVQPGSPAVRGREHLPGEGAHARPRLRGSRAAPGGSGAPARGAGRDHRCHAPRSRARGRPAADGRGGQGAPRGGPSPDHGRAHLRPHQERDRRALRGDPGADRPGSGRRLHLAPAGRGRAHRHAGHRPPRRQARGHAPGGRGLARGADPPHGQPRAEGALPEAPGGARRRAAARRGPAGRPPPGHSVLAAPRRGGRPRRPPRRRAHGGGAGDHGGRSRARGSRHDQRQGGSPS